MGVHDYICFCHSTEGEQCLSNHDDCCDGAEDSNENEQLPNDEILSEYECNPSGCGYGDARLIVFTFNEPINNNETVIELIKAGKFKSKRCIEVEYSWDNWDFSDNAPRGYRYVLSCGYEADGRFPTSVWPAAVYDPKGNESEYSEDLETDFKTWVINVCPLCCKILLDYDDGNTEPTSLNDMCSHWLEEIAEKHDVPLGKSKKQFISRVRNHFKYLSAK